MSRYDRYAAHLASLLAKRQSAAAAPMVAEALLKIGCQVLPWDSGDGLTINQTDTDAHLDAARDAKIAELRAKGFAPTIVIIRRLSKEPTTSLHLRAEQSGDRSGREAISAGSATPPRSKRS